MCGVRQSERDDLVLILVHVLIALQSYYVIIIARTYLGSFEYSHSRFDVRCFFLVLRFALP